MTLTGNATAVAPGVPVNFGASGGTAPYTYSVANGGAGGTINSSTGAYVAPQAYGVDTIAAVDAHGVSSSAAIKVGSYLVLLGDIIQSQLGLAQGQVYLWDGKLTIPTDSNLYVAISVENVRQFGFRFQADGSGSGMVGRQSGNFQAQVGIDIISRGTLALDNKEQIALALISAYSQAQQELNSFYIAQLPTGFVNLSEADGAAIPYRFHISVKVMYAMAMNQNIGYFGTIPGFTVTPQP